MGSGMNDAEDHRGRGRPRDEAARTRILQGALELLETHGFAEITADAVAERAGASKATIYRWWPNKAGVLIEALREAVGQELPFPNTGDLQEDLRVQLRNFLTMLSGRRGRIFKAFIAAGQSDAEIAETFRSTWIAPRRAEAKALLERYRGKELREDTDLELTMDALYGPLYYRLLTGHGPLTPEYTDELAEMVLTGIRKR